MYFFKRYANNKTKFFVITYLMAWIFIIIMTWIYWSEMHWSLKLIFTIAEIFFIPDIDAIRSVLKKRN